VKTVTGPRPAKAGALLFFLAASARAAAQEPGPVEITISGGIEMTWASRDRVINEASVWTPGGLPAGNPLRAPDTFILPALSIRFDIDASPVRAAFEIGNPVLHADSADPRFQEDRLGGAAAIGFRLKQAWIEYLGFLRLGEQDFVWDPTGLGEPLFLAPSGSKSPWAEIPDSTVPPFPPSGTNTVPQTRRDRKYPVGATARFDDVTLFALLLSEGGSPSADEGVYGGAISETFDRFRASAIAAFMKGAGAKQEVWTGGTALSADLSPFLLALEGYRQFGSAGVDLRASGSAVRGIARYADGAWAQAVYVRVSGDRRGDDRRWGGFLSYEDNNATLIVEGNEFGFNIDMNYWSAQLSGGTSVDVGGKPLRPRATAAFFRFLQAIPLPPDPPPGVGGRSRALGTEIDAGVDLEWSAHLSFSATAGVLFGATALEGFTLLGDNRATLYTVGFRFTF
jgi:hypothetical protein